MSGGHPSPPTPLPRERGADAAHRAPGAARPVRPSAGGRARTPRGRGTPRARWGSQAVSLEPSGVHGVPGSMVRPRPGRPGTLAAPSRRRRRNWSVARSSQERAHVSGSPRRCAPPPTPRRNEEPAQVLPAASPACKPRCSWPEAAGLTDRVIRSGEPSLCRRVASPAGTGTAHHPTARRLATAPLDGRCRVGHKSGA